MVACKDESSRIIRSLASCLSAWTVCACWRRLSRRENCFPQWQVKGRSPVCFLWMERRSGTGSGRRGGKGKEHGPNVPGQVFAPAKNHATIAITTTLECFCGGRTISPVDARGILERGLGVGEDEGSGHVSVGGVRGRGVHYRGRDGGGQQSKSTDISIFRALSFPIYFLCPATLPVLIRFFLALILIRTNAITHPHSSSPADPRCPPPPYPFPVPDPTELLHSPPNFYLPPFHHRQTHHAYVQCQFEPSLSFTAPYNNKKTGLLTYCPLGSRMLLKKNRRNLA